ncbi:MAG: hypothetical protein EA425_17065 [Puniceicoccaceae bacterium]|nr:MAG: hypothetical protein EA425_17065 [Puniceicoccaceae bacterium]
MPANLIDDHGRPVGRVPLSIPEVIARDAALPIPQTSFVPQDSEPDVRVSIDLDEGWAYLGNGVAYHGFLTNGTIPGPTIIVNEGDIVEFTVNNRGTIPHGASIHAAYTQTSKYLGNIPAGQSRKVLFRATYPGVFMYHCAPGGHAIPMHVLFGQYGMMVVKPKESQYQLEKILGHGPDVEIYLLQHEWYASGYDAIKGNPTYTTFNGKLFRYVEEPIVARPGDYVRIYFLNVGPNLISTFHLVGIIWDFAYWQGHPDVWMPGGQTVTAGPSDSWVVEFRIPPDEGAYTMLSHAVGATSTGAIGLLVADSEAEPGPIVIKSDGPAHSPEEMAQIREDAVRIISPFEPGTTEADVPVVFPPDAEEVVIRIIGNSFHPKVAQITAGTTVTWVNEDVFTYLAGEVSGVHNAASISGPSGFVTPLLAHAESASHTFEEVGEYVYICTPHPYMKARLIVTERPEPVRGGAGAGPFMTVLIFVALLLGLAALLKPRK